MSDSTQPNSIGCGLLGCLGGVALGLLGGGILLVLLSLLNAVTNTLPTLASTPSDGVDLRITIEEAFLNRFIEQPAEGTTSIDVLPGNQVRVLADTTVTVFGAAVPVQINGLFAFQPQGQNIEIALLDTQISGFEIPFDLNDMFSEDIASINQELNGAVDEIEATLGTPVEITGLTTSDTTIELEMRAVPGGGN